jgi:2-dehydropantoate 2-reductase
MRILVIGAGALGGYFGACLVRAGRNVTFLVRQRRAEQLAHDGMQVLSPHGDFKVSPTTVSSDAIREPFDLVLVAVKSYSLDEAMNHFAPAIGSSTMILPILNGMGHIERLTRRFGAERVVGGIAAALMLRAGSSSSCRSMTLCTARSRAASVSGRARWKPVSKEPASIRAPATWLCRICGKSSCNLVLVLE